MNSWSRRQFLGSSAALSGMAVLSSCGLGGVDLGKADMVIMGGTFYSMDPNWQNIDAVAIRGDRILAVGSKRDLAALVGPATKVVDTTGMTVTPGFIDAHSHPLFANEAISTNVNYRNISEVQEALRAAAANTPPGQWVLGHMYDDTKFNDGRPMYKRDLDAVSTEHPIFIRHRGGHTGVVNSKAFELAGITIDTPNPTKGAYYRDGNELDGRVAEYAIDPFFEVGVWPEADRAANQENARLITKRMLASGMTSTTDAYGEEVEWIAYQDALYAEELNCRVSFMPSGKIFAAMKAAGIRSGFGNNMLNVGAVKYGADGSASERTMRMSTPFEGRPNDYGILTMTQDEIDAAVDDAVAHGFRIGIHANGDVTIDMVLQAYERVLANWEGENPRFRIEHCSLVNPELLTRIKATGSIPTPFYTYAYYHGEKWHNYGHEKMEWMFAHKSFLDYGIPVAPASDYTPGPFEPMMALQSMATRKDPQGNVWGQSQRVSVMDAMHICTVNGAYASFEEDIKGSLTPGKLADICILADDPTKVDPDTIKDIKINMTIIGGKVGYEA